MHVNAAAVPVAVQSDKEVPRCLHHGRSAMADGSIYTQFSIVYSLSPRRFASLFSRSIGLVLCKLGPVLAREGHVGQHIVLA
jgi:hypothetical protein